MITKTKIDPVDIVFCGLVREKDLFKKSIEDMVLLRKEGLIDNIILSTWEGEIEKSPEIIPFLEKNKVRVLKTPELKDKGNGNIWCQMKSLEEGLKVIGPDKFVLKTRTDIFININFLRKLFSLKKELLKIRKNIPKGNIFKYRVWAPWFELTRPFFMGDECFFGHHHDMSLLYNYDCSYDTEYGLSGDRAHIRRFIHPFLEDYPILYKSMGKYAKDRFLKAFFINNFREFKDSLFEVKFLRVLSENNRFKILKRRLKDKDFLKNLAAYYCILYSHFYINSFSFPNQVTFREHSDLLFRSDEKDIENLFTKEKVRLPLGGQIYIYDMDFLNNLCEKKINSTILGKSLTEEVDNFNELKD